MGARLSGLEGKEGKDDIDETGVKNATRSIACAHEQRAARTPGRPHMVLAAVGARCLQHARGNRRSHQTTPKTLASHPKKAATYLHLLASIFCHLFCGMEHASDVFASHNCCHGLPAFARSLIQE